MRGPTARTPKSIVDRLLDYSVDTRVPHTIRMDMRRARSMILDQEVEIGSLHAQHRVDLYRIESLIAERERLRRKVED